MGRKKRPAADMAQQQHQQQPQYNQYGQPMMPPPHAAPYTAPHIHIHHHAPPPIIPQQQQHGNQQQPQNNQNKKQKTESFSVKKYRPSGSYRTIEAFQRYTKSHRMTDATFTAISPPTRGATPSAPIVYCTRIGGSDLSWGRGKTRDVAIDNACRAAFALVAAHGYTDFECNEDCLTSEPMVIMSSGVAPPLPPVPMGMAPPLPPVPPPGMPGMPPGMGMGMHHGIGMGMNMNMPPPGFAPGMMPPPPMHGIPLPPGMPPPLPGIAPPPPRNENVMLIPQAKSLSAEVAVPSVLKKDKDDVLSSGGTSGAAPLSLSLEKKEKSGKTFQKKIKGGILLYDAEADGGGKVVTMEMRRAVSDRYKTVLMDCWKRRKAELAKS